MGAHRVLIFTKHTFHWFAKATLCYLGKVVVQLLRCRGSSGAAAAGTGQSPRATPRGGPPRPAGPADHGVTRPNVTEHATTRGRRPRPPPTHELHQRGSLHKAGRVTSNRTV